MLERDLRLAHPAPERVGPAIPHAVVGTMVFVLTEIMLFAGLISAYAIAATNSPMWPPPDQPRLPIESTLINTAALLVSGALVFLAGRRFDVEPKLARAHMVGAAILGGAFVGLQGFEWARLLADGLGLTTSQHASFFYLIVGAHAVHAVGGLAVLLAQVRYLFAGTLTRGGFQAFRIFWYFVVLLWPVLYWRVYLA